MNTGLILGCIADDFTGASDSASFLASGGLQTVLYNGIPNEQSISDTCQAIVIALKTRTQETLSAVENTLAAMKWLKKQGAQQIYIKYCSTFDSTPTGNIGPIMDALLEETNTPYTVLCPSLPVNGRIVKDGHLFVNGVPLHKSPMKNHPLTPMWDSRIASLMKPQSKYMCFEIHSSEYKFDNAHITSRIQEYCKKYPHFYIVPDYTSDEDAERIMGLFGSLPILSGGSGLLAAFAKTYRSELYTQPALTPNTNGSCILLAGSCSEMTRMQIDYIQNKQIPSMQLKPLELLSGTQTINDLFAFLMSHPNEPVLFYSSDTPEQVKKNQMSGSEAIAELLENTTALLAQYAVETGRTRIIVAGGETSGAITKQLGFDSYLIGDSIAPGVPIMIPRANPNIRLVLKSGNFGQEDFFEKAIHMTGL